MLGKFLLVLGTLFLFGCVSGGADHKQGMHDIVGGDYESGLARLEQAMIESPGNLTFRLDYKTQRERVIQRLIGGAERALLRRDLDSAQDSYHRVLGIEPRNGRALRGLESIERGARHTLDLQNARRSWEAGDVVAAKLAVRQVLAEDPTFIDAQRLQKDIAATEIPMDPSPRLGAAVLEPVSLQFREAKLAMVFEALARQTDINFIFDKDVKQDAKTTIFVSDVSIEQAIDLVIAQNQLARQIISENMVIIYPNLPAKQKEYQQQIVKTFYLTNTAPAAFAELLKTMLNIQTIFVDERSDAVVVRDTPDVIRMAEKLMASIDVAEAEVMLEVEVIEITRSRLQQLGINFPGSATINPTALAGDPLVLADFRDQDQTTLTVTPVPITIDLHKEAGVSNLLASPRIRVRNKEKAKVQIGQRVPTIVNSVTPVSSGSSVVTGSVQYVDVGLTLEVLPTIHQDGDVTIDVHLEVSNLIREISNPTSGTLAYQIGTRNASTILRLKSGETQILAGLIQDIDRSTTNKIPGLGDMPLIGRLFGTNKDDVEKTEIVLSITPRVVRHQPRGAGEDTEFWYGTESRSHSALASVARRSDARSRRTASRGSSVQRQGEDERMDDESDADALPPKRLTLDWQGLQEVTVGDEFEVSLKVSGSTALDAIRSQLRYDPAALELVSASAGHGIAGRVGENAIVTRTGRVNIDVQGLGGSFTGNGDVITLRFRSLVARPATMLSVQQFAANGEDGLAVPVMAPRPWVIKVKRSS